MEASERMTVTSCACNARMQDVLWSCILWIAYAITSIIRGCQNGYHKKESFGSSNESKS